MNITLHEVFFIHNAKIPSNSEKKHEKLFGYFLERVSIDMPIIPINIVYLQMEKRCCFSTQIIYINYIELNTYYYVAVRSGEYNIINCFSRNL